MMETNKKPISKGVYILPNLFTVGSMFAAFYGIIMAHGGNYSGCAIAILVSAVLDGMDGKIARLTHSASDFGVQLDSLADVIAFGAAPAYMIYFWQLRGLGSIGLAGAFLFMACGALRLARFNVMAASSASKKFFTGLPIPAAGCALACITLFYNYLPDKIYPVMTWFSLVLTIALGLLMVSRVPYFAFKEFAPLRIKTFSMMVVFVLFFALIVAAPKVFGFSFFVAYLFSGPIYLLVARRRRKIQSAAPGGITPDNDAKD
ncbi:MAG: CDP-diacylglycerol--serine O-phosphatidyltransferase [Deltaproteobacteria bacterium]|jgi:CDP-diacylglycerol--serine O-phosphatidyltransferase|nr:CDP-diacylglycerol--serine O-phosphatidyltransferase [Deltaproteobacteria bacterium]